MSCLSCRRGLHEECIYTVSDSCCCPVPETIGQVRFDDDSREPPEENSRRNRGRPTKHDNDIGTSAGRKRAAVAYPLDKEKPCEWRGLSNCGGGKYPIIGCLVGKQQARHHGPVKATYRNEEGNIHRICTACHNLWHAKNDPVYDEVTYDLLPHNPRKATPEEMIQRGT